MNKFTNFFLVLMFFSIQGICQSYVYIEKTSDSALSEAQVMSGLSMVDPAPVNSFSMSQFKTRLYAYAVVRDNNGNFLRLADSASWVSSDSNKMTAAATPLKQYECRLTRKREWVTGANTITARNPVSGTVSNALTIQLSLDGCFIRLIDSDKKARIDTLRCMVGDSIHLKTQGTPHDFPTAWETWTALWSVAPGSIQFSYPVPARDSVWVCKPTAPGTGMLVVSLGGYMDQSMPMFVAPGTSTIAGRNSFIHPDRFTATTSGDAVCLHFPLPGAHQIKVFSLTGTLICSSRTSANDVRIRLPKGVYIVSVQPAGSAEKFTKRIVSK